MPMPRATKPSDKVVGKLNLASGSDSDQQARREESSLLSRLRSAIAEDRLVLDAQPIRPVHEDAVHGFETLVRMLNPDGSIEAPFRFIPVAERYGTIDELDEWVTRETLRLWSGAPAAAATGATAFINLSAVSLCREGFADRIVELFEEAGVDPRSVCFEITETGTMDNFEAALGFIDRLRGAGARFALDDFGVGFSSLGHLRRIPVTYLKIDGSLIRDVDTDPVKATMVEAIVAMAGALAVETIAEHVETRDELVTLTDLGVGSVQGYYLGHPDDIAVYYGVGVAT